MAPQSLRNCAREILAVSALPALWKRYSPSQVTDSLVEFLSKNLDLELAYVRVPACEAEAIESACSAGALLTAREAGGLAMKLEPWLRPSRPSAGPREVPHPLREGTLRISAFGSALLLVVGSGRANFPLETESLLLEMATNQAAIAIDNAQLYQDAQEALQARDELLSIASHELKMPITSLKLQLQLTSKSIKPGADVTPSTEKLSRAVALSLQQVDRLTVLVDDLLDIARIRAGRLAIRREDVDLSELVRSVTGCFFEDLRGAGCTLRLELPEGLRGFWDPSRLEQVLVNLLNNALKYAPGTPISISLRHEPGVAKLEVRDGGPGIARDRQSTIFNRFERGTPPKRVGGLGLGLFIVREIVSAHQGTIEIESEEGQGARFTVSLPLRPSHPGQA